MHVCVVLFWTIFPGLVLAQTVNRSAEAIEKHTFFEKLNTYEREKFEQEAARRRNSRDQSSFAPPPAIMPFGDWDYYYVTERALHWMPDSAEQPKEVTVPIGFVTDLASIPRALWSRLRPEGRYSYAAIVHDYLYWTQDRTREEADLILKYAMEDSKVDSATVSVIYAGVRAGGGPAWKANAKRKRDGGKRILKSFPPDFTTSWEEWRQDPNHFSD